MPNSGSWWLIKNIVKHCHSTYTILAIIKLFSINADFSQIELLATLKVLIFFFFDITIDYFALKLGGANVPKLLCKITLTFWVRT
jgi:hypothetical protein